VAVDLYGGDDVRKFLALGFGVHGLELKGLARSIASKYSMAGLLSNKLVRLSGGRAAWIERGRRELGFCRPGLVV
jgi:hypothetical protein